MLQLILPILRHVHTLDIFVPSAWTVCILGTTHFVGSSPDTQLYTHVCDIVPDMAAKSRVLLDCFVINSHVRGYHIYKDIWNPSKGEVLQLQREPSNPEDKFAAIICLDGQVVGRVPAELVRTFSLFLARECNSITATITDARINHGIGLGLEIPCFYKLNGPKVYVNRVKELLGNSD